jgi:low affinity Fe/Cu permease
VARWLASPIGFVQACVVTVLWCVAIAHGLDHHGFWFLFVATLISFVTQFTIAFQNEQASEALDLALRNQADTMRLLVALTQEIRGEQEEILAELEDLAAGVDAPHMDETKLD